ncbi:beta-class carbonic anhydrase [Salinicoccus carnicancri]|uniref:beta-class carbonic anhydrase n=1 Tax=Salinicoccus carnicancri TaxID=558170 RepID=UPI00031B9056|nr:carbonic anhydrase [Salinicoccus carnicancri]
MSLLHDLLEYNQQFVENKEYEKYTTTKSPDKKMVLVSCMDTRLTELSTKALGLKNGDIKHIQNAGAMIAHPYGSTMRSILVAVYMLGADEVMIMGHHDCGFGALQPEPVMEEMENRGINPDVFDTLKHSGIDIKEWLKGFDSVEESVTENVAKVRQHPLMVPDIPVHGVVINPDDGKIDLVTDGYEYN